MRVELNSESWHLGYQDGLRGKKEHKPKASDRLAYNSGYIEGKATRLAFPGCTPEETVQRVEQALLRRNQQK